MKTHFLIWMLCYPLVSAAVRFTASKIRAMEAKEPFDDGVQGAAAFVEFCIWFGVGAALWTA